jgi:hypothetical protein
MTLAEIEQEIREHLAEVARLRYLALRTPELRAQPGAAVRTWLMRAGASEKDAQGEIVAVLNERRAAHGDPPVGTCSRRERR